MLMLVGIESGHDRQILVALIYKMTKTHTCARLHFDVGKHMVLVRLHHLIPYHRGPAQSYERLPFRHRRYY